MGKIEIAACAGVAVVAFALIALIWILTERAVQEQQAEIRDRAEHALSAQAATIAETIRHELLMIDQSLTILQAAWKADSANFDLNKWQAAMPALASVADDLFIADEKHVIRQDILPKAIGQGIGSAYVTFPHGSLEQFQSDGSRNQDSLVLQGDASQPIEGREFLTYIVRPLDHPTGWLIGASFRSDELTRLFAESSLGSNAIVALTDTKRGIVQSIVGPASRRPRTDISQSPLFAAMSRSPSGIFLGETAIDGVERMHAFHHVEKRDMAVVVAANWSEVMGVANDLATGAHALAFVASGLVLVIAGIVLWELYTIRSSRRQKRVFDRNRSELERLRTEEGVLVARAQLNAARLKIVVDSTADGIALFDFNLKLVQWNHPFHRGIGIELKQDMLLDGVLRAQAANGMFGADVDTEAEIVRRIGILQSGDTSGLSQPGPDNETLTLRGLPIAEGGFMLLLNGLELWQPVPAQAPVAEVDEAVVPEPVASTLIEW
jgi:PAS domain-containing protein